MKRLRNMAAMIGIVAVLSSVAWTPGAARIAMPDVPTVFITATGKKYHRAACRHLQKSREELPLDEAQRRGYGPCGTCKPQH